MSAVLKATSIFGGLAVTGAAANFAYKSPEQSFSQPALAAAEHSADVISAGVRPKLPSNYFQISVGDYKWSNARSV
ncbi:hypothetical protein B0A50_08240 [Salinomyces thailandicus]|uniref:Uncharacterized protein n=1 Tax=Salinomyces thailandicus TaxID=706561 RepID=A0A4U0TK71_9PEZI|nr:hypothetical protein B0A50_08240 [Salinomyces thailandica]